MKYSTLPPASSAIFLPKDISSAKKSPMFFAKKPPSNGFTAKKPPKAKSVKKDTSGKRLPTAQPPAKYPPHAPSAEQPPLSSPSPRLKLKHNQPARNGYRFILEVKKKFYRFLPLNETRFFLRFNIVYYFFITLMQKKY